MATDLAESLRRAVAGHLDHSVKMADPRRPCRQPGGRCGAPASPERDPRAPRAQGRSALSDPKLLLSGAERLDESAHQRMLLGLRRRDSHDELLGAWLAKESVRDVYLTQRLAEARTLLRKAIVGCQGDKVAQIRTLGHTLERWSEEILNHHRTGASNGPTEGMNLCVKRIKRAGRGFSCFEHYRLRVLHAGGVTWPRRSSPPQVS